MRATAPMLYTAEGDGSMPSTIGAVEMGSNLADEIV
jgi:hypothetical protein